MENAFTRLKNAFAANVKTVYRVRIVACSTAFNIPSYDLVFMSKFVIGKKSAVALAADKRKKYDVAVDEVTIEKWTFNNKTSCYYLSNMSYDSDSGKYINVSSKTKLPCNSAKKFVTERKQDVR